MLVFLAMILEARSRSCFANDYVLKLADASIGTFQARALSEQVDVRLGRRRLLRFEKHSFFGSRLTLTDTTTGSIVAEADRAGTFTSAWDLRLSNGPARLVSAGMFNSGWVVEHAGHPMAEVNRLGMCDGSWYVNSHDVLAETDLIFIGLTYNTILRRNAAVVVAAT